MSLTDRQNRLLVNEDWKRIYQSYRNADFQSYDFDNLRRTMIQYLRENYPEDFNDYIESSEYIALIDLIAFLGQNLSFRIDLNARENFLETAERRESVLRLARLLSYNPKRNQAANGLLKIESVKTTEDIIDSSGLNLSGLNVRWNDPSNGSWFEQFTKILNSSLPNTNPIGRPLKSSNISGVPTEQYRFNALNTDVPTFKFTKNIQGVSTQFEITSSDLQSNSIVEEPPLPGNSPAFLYRDDGQGAGSSNTGFFVHFRQGELKKGEFTVDSPTPNQIIAVDTPNINNTDVWLYNLDLSGFESELWTKVEAVEGNNVIYNSLLKNIRNVFAVSSRVEDRINLIFSDGVFGEIPSGNFRVYYRVSDNRAMNIGPKGMANINIEIPYISRRNTTERLTLVLSLKTNVSNSSVSESNASIKQNAPSTYYTQNRLVTAEDYNIGPLGISQDIIKAKSLNRLSSGISRYFDLKDATGKYSNTSLFSTDGILYQEEYQEKKKFNFTTQSDIEGAIYNIIQPILKDINTKNFYYKNYPPLTLLDLNAKWNSVTDETNSNTGYFTDNDNLVLQVGFFTANSLNLLKSGAMAKFIAPEGFHFMEDNSLMEGPADHIGSKTYIWTKVVGVRDDGTDTSSEQGPITFSDRVPSGCILEEIKPELTESLTTDTITQIIDQTFAYRNFALRYDQQNRLWRLVLEDDINSTDDFSLGKAGNNSGQNLDASWLLNFRTDGESYDITHRNLRYIFESDTEIKFFYDNADTVFEPKTGKTYKDKIEVLNINTRPNSLESFTRDFTWSISDAYRDENGYLDSKKIQVTFFDSDNDGVYDDINLFEEIVDTNTNPSTKLIFQKKYTGPEGLVDFRYFDNSLNTIMIRETIADVGAWSKYSNNQIFYIIDEDTFKILDKENNRWIVTADYRAFYGRSNLKFHYLHVADSNQRIDPSASNIIDVYLLTKNYDTEYRLWLDDEIPTKPLPPSSDELFRSYGSTINSIKSISDEVIYHPVKYKTLFGAKALSDLQVSFKVIKNPEVVLNDNELKSQIVSAINQFFSSENWDFGDTFYFQELSTFIMNRLAPDLASIIIVPKQQTQSFGSLFEIKSEPDELFISGATVSDIEIITEITADKIKSSGNIINSASVNNTGIQSSTNNTNMITNTSTNTGGGYRY